MTTADLREQKQQLAPFPHTLRAEVHTPIRRKPAGNRHKPPEPRTHIPAVRCKPYSPLRAITGATSGKARTRSATASSVGVWPANHARRGRQLITQAM